MMLRPTAVFTALLVLVLVVPKRAMPSQSVDVTGAWEVTITRPAGSVTGLAILSQDGSTVTGMIGPAETDMMPADGRVEGNTLTLMTRPRTGRTAAFAKCDVTITRDHMTGTIDSDKGTIAFVRKKRLARSAIAGSARRATPPCEGEIPRARPWHDCASRSR
jgi:hypothetical protein